MVIDLEMVFCFLIGVVSVIDLISQDLLRSLELHDRISTKAPVSFFKKKALVIMKLIKILLLFKVVIETFNLMVSFSQFSGKVKF